MKGRSNKRESHLKRIPPEGVGFFHYGNVLRDDAYGDYYIDYMYTAPFAKKAEL